MPPSTHPAGDLRPVHGASGRPVQPEADRLLRPGDLERGHDRPGAVEQLLAAAVLPHPPGHRRVLLDARVVLPHRRLLPVGVPGPGAAELDSKQNKTVARAHHLIRQFFFFVARRLRLLVGVPDPGAAELD